MTDKRTWAYWAGRVFGAILLTCMFLGSILVLVTAGYALKERDLEHRGCECQCERGTNDQH